MFPKKIYFVRHGSTGPANRGKLVGRTDIPVHEEGMRSVRRLKTVFEGVEPELICSSPMIRTLQTAESLRDVCSWSDEIRIESDLREIDFGQWEMKTWLEIMESEATGMDELTENDHFVFPDGESLIAFRERVAAVLERIKARPEKEIVIVSHGGVIRTFICLALGIPARHYLLFNIKPASVTVIDLFHQGGVLSGMNL